MACSCTSQPCDCDDSVVVTADDVALLAGYIGTIENVVESTALTTITPGGRETDTLVGALTKLGFQPPIDYAGGISFTSSDQTKTIERDGVIYAPIPGEIPFTTSGTWAADDDAKFYVVQSVSLYSGDVVISKPTVADMQADASLQIGNIVHTEGYKASGDLGAAVYRVVADGTGTVDGGRFITLTAASLQAQAVFDSDRINVAQFGAEGNGTTDDSDAIQAAVDAIEALGGGELEFSLTGGGTFLCNFILKPSVSLRGASRDVTLKPSTNSPVITLQGDADVARVALRGFTIDGTDTQGTFTSQDGIRMDPDAGQFHTSVLIEDCRLVACGAAGIAVDASDGSILEQVGLLRIERCTIEDCTGPGVSLVGNVAVSGIVACDIFDNGDGTDSLPNVQIDALAFTGTAPQKLVVSDNRFETPAYASSGTCLALSGVLDVTIDDNTFVDFHTAIKIFDSPNGGIRVTSNRFRRSSGDIDALVELVQCDGFVFDGNNVNAATTGPVGLLLPDSAADATRIAIGGTNVYGGLTKASDALPVSEIATTDTVLSMPVTNGTVPVNLDANGTASVNTLNDFNDETAQFVDGDTVTLRITNASRELELVDGTGNLLLAGAANFTLDEVGDSITLSWFDSLSSWVEQSRVSLT